MSDYQHVAEEVRNLLLDDENLSEWLLRYSDYADTITANLATVKTNRSRLRAWIPFKFYMNVTNAKTAKRMIRFEVRYLGQTVAELKSSTDGVTISTKATKDKDYEQTNLRDFGCDIKLDDVPWAGTEAAAFRSHFKKREAQRNITDNKKKKNTASKVCYCQNFQRARENPCRILSRLRLRGYGFQCLLQ